MGVDGKVLGESEISGLAAVGSCWTQLAPDSSTAGLLQAKAESIILAFGTDKSPKGMRPMDERTRAQNSLKGMQTAQDPHWSMRKKVGWKQQQNETTLSWLYTADCLAEGTECSLWWDQVPEDRCLWWKIEAEIMMVRRDTWRKAEHVSKVETRKEGPKVFSLNV